MPLKYKVGPDAPGHYKRLRAYFEHLEKLVEVEDNLERYEIHLDWLASYLSSPPTKFLKRVAVRRASQQEIDDLVKAIRGDVNIDPKKEETSGGG